MQKGKYHYFDKLAIKILYIYSQFTSFLQNKHDYCYIVYADSY